MLIGNLGRDPEMNYNPDGLAITKFSLAVSTGKGDKETTTWYAVTAFRQLAETIGKYARKGQQVFVEGALLPRQYTSKDGRNAVSLDVTCDVFQFLGTKADNNAVPATPGKRHQDEDDLENHPF